MKDLFTTQVACEYGQLGKIEEWVHLFLCNDGNNIPFSDGLKREKRYYTVPLKLPLNLFVRCCGPEENMKFLIPQEGFDLRVERIANRLATGWEMPPLIINYERGVFTLNDGNHRYEALIRSSITHHHVIIWSTTEESFNEFNEIINKTGEAYE